MTARQRGALHWQEMRYWQWCAALTTNESERRHYLAMAQDARRDMMTAEQTTTTQTKGTK